MTIMTTLFDADGIAYARVTHFEEEIPGTLRDTDLGWLRGNYRWEAEGNKTRLASLAPYAIDPTTREIIKAETTNG